MTRLRLGLIGDNIALSQAPLLHQCCGQLTGLDVTYERIVPADRGQSFDEAFAWAIEHELDGVNVTLPYKTRVLPMVTVSDPFIAQIGSVNTVRLNRTPIEGFNTDFGGFVAAYRAAFGTSNPGTVMLIGAGGVGKALGFALTILEAKDVIIVDPNETLARSLASALTETGRIVARSGRIEEISDVDGVLNATPLGMNGYPGSAVPDGTFPRCQWAFDAVYTPADTPFRAQALAAGASFLSGFELFFHQGVLAFEVFSGRPFDDLPRLREMLSAPM